MSLFPAYAPDGNGESKTEEESYRMMQCNVELLEKEAARESALLTSDSGDEEPLAPSSTPEPGLPDDFYFDGKADGANLGVTTLYIPGRPIYKRASIQPLGTSERRRRGRQAGRRRYFLQVQPEAASVSVGLEAVERARAMRRLLADSPLDEELWLRYIHFQEEWADGAEWRTAAEQALAAGAVGVRLRAALHRARIASLPSPDLLQAISSTLCSEKCEKLRLEGWLRLLWTVSGTGGPAELQRAAAAALAALAHCARAYPLVLYVYGATLRAAGLWEQLVLLVELVCAVNFPRSAAFPPPALEPEQARDAERRLQAAEDKVIDSGLPLSTVWVRVERLRSAAHWRPLAAAGGLEADPQRAPAAADVQELVRGVHGSSALLLCVSMLRVARVPLLPLSETSRRACFAGVHDETEDGSAMLCALHRTRRRLTPRTGDAAALRDALAAVREPPHYFSDEAGYLTWVSALWEACCSWSEPSQRPALVRWWLRWLHALARCAPTAEGRRVRAQARQVLKRHAPSDPIAFALFARIEADVADPEGARRAALQAVRAGVAAGADADAEGTSALFAARVAEEVCGAGSSAARWARCAAATRSRLPPDALLHRAPPPHELLQDALQQCWMRCEELERGFDSDSDSESDSDSVVRALSCGGAGEWGAARVQLETPRGRAALLTRLLQLGYNTIHRSAAALQYYEACACALSLALAGSARAAAARALLPLFPNNAFLALASSAGSVWWSGSGRGSGGAVRSQCAALASVLPVVLTDGLATERVARACARAGARGAGGAALCTLRLEAEARTAPAPRTHRLLLAALHTYPYHKSLYVVGAAWLPAEAEALCDAALERALRVHALPHELHVYALPHELHVHALPHELHVHALPHELHGHASLPPDKSI